MSQKIRILVVDDHSLFREGLGRLLEAEPDFKVVGNCGSMREALCVLKQEQVDIILLDYDLGRDNGMSFQKEAAKRGSQARVLMVAAGMSDQDMICALENGASGIFFTESTPSQLVEAIHKVIRGEPWLDPKAMKAVISAVKGRAKERDASQNLSKRERAVLKGVFEGFPTRRLLLNWRSRRAW